MDLLPAIAAHLGLVVFTLLCVALFVYLAFAMIHPEWF